MTIILFVCFTYLRSEMKSIHSNYEANAAVFVYFSARNGLGLALSNLSRYRVTTYDSGRIINGRIASS